MQAHWILNTQEGDLELQEINRLHLPLAEKVQAAYVQIEIAPAEKMFFNGYQSWSWCPEVDPSDIMDSIRLPRLAKSRFRLDRYGDYHFHKYPRKKGVFHGYSYCYFRNDETFTLFASLNEQDGYTVFDYDSRKKQLTISRDAMGVNCDGEFALLDLYVKTGSEKEVFDGWFEAMGTKPRTTKQLYGYSSWYNRYENISEESILNDLKGCRKILEKNDLFQIDDGWEVTVGEWEADPAKFPQGMKKAADLIHEQGYQAGIWLAPFVTTSKSRIFREHPDWLIYHKGMPWLNGSNWGGFFSLDLEIPEVREHIRSVFKTVFDDWGFDLVKLDFLYAAAPFPTEEKSRARRMMEAIDFLRKVCGDHPILACGVPLWPVFGKVEYCRIGCDVSLDWDDKWFMHYAHRERVSTSHSTDNTVFRRQLNNRAFVNDPDVIFLREEGLELNAKERAYLYTINSLLGGVLLTSDDPGSYSQAKIDMWQKLRRIDTTIIKEPVFADDPPRLRYEDAEGHKVIKLGRPE